MKHLYFLLITFISHSASAQINFCAGYSASAPGCQMNDKINMLHSLSIGSDYTIPKTGGRIQAGVELSIGSYAMTTKEQTFVFGNGSSTVTDVNYSSNVFQAALRSKVFAFKKAKVNPYIMGKAGYASFFSNIFIEDPEDEGGCKALDQRNIISDGTIMAGYGGGILVDFSLIAPRSKKGRQYIDISVNKISGGKINYINTKKLYDAADHTTFTAGSKPLNVKFINASTQQIHEHQVAEVFTTPMDLLEFKLSFVLSWINRKGVEAGARERARDLFSRQ